MGICLKKEAEKGVKTQKKPQIFGKKLKSP